MNEGQTVTLTGDSGFCDEVGSKIKYIVHKYDPNTGERYKVIITEEDQQFDSRTGFAITPPLAYYIKEIVG